MKDAKKITYKGVKMNVLTRKNGEIRYQIDLRAAGNLPKGVPARPSFPTKQMAADEFKARSVAIMDGTYAQKAKAYTATLKKIVVDYGIEYENQHYWKNSKKGFAARALAYFKEHRVANTLTTADGRAYRRDLYDEISIRKGPRAVGTVRKHLGCLAHIWDLAAENRKVDPRKDNPFKLKKRNKKYRKGKYRVLTEDEIKRLLAESSEPLRQVIKVGFYSMMRPVDYLKWRWTDIGIAEADDDGGSQGQILFFSKKQGKEIALPVWPSLRATFDEIEKWQRKVNRGKRFEFILCHKNGEPYRDTPRTAFKSACNRAGIDANGCILAPYCLKHSAATIYRDRHGSLDNLCALIGHFDKSVTSTYARVTGGLQVRELSLLEGVLEGRTKEDMLNCHILSLLQRYPHKAVLQALKTQGLTPVEKRNLN